MRHDKWARLFVVGVGVMVPLAAATVPAQSTKPATKSARSAAKAMPRRVAAADTSGGAPKITASSTTSHTSASAVDPVRMAAQVDQLIAVELKKTGAEIAPRCSDEDFLRRVSFDIAGVSPAPQDMTLFDLDTDSHKRQAAVERLLKSEDYSQHWARYWRDVIQSRATETRPQFLIPVLQNYESWMARQLAANRSWDQIATELLTATGDITEAGQTAFIIAQRAEPDEVAAETSRVFLGIQLQCANCHDHPTDNWKREQFHSLAAFFPRMQARQKPGADPMRQTLELASLTVDGRRPGGGDFFRRMQERPEEFIRRLDKNGDQKISKEESSRGPGGGQLFAQLFNVGDVNKDGQLTAEEIKKIPPPPMRPGLGTPEYHMPDLQHPQAEGKKLDPTFFLGNLKAGTGLSDLERRQSLSRYITAATNPWFAKAFVNRIWGQLVGEGFYMPIDDIGPERTANHPQALEALSAGFTSSGYDIAWLLRTIANTETYQRQIRPRDPKHAAVFASAAPVRLRADQLYDALGRVLGFKEQDSRPAADGDMMMMYRRNNSPRAQFQQLFGFDPSTPPDEINGTIPQALFMMNSGFVNSLIRAAGQTRLHQILDKFKSDDDALIELFIVVHAREPSAKEQKTCREYIAQVNNRQEAFEDILWSLLNSTEFQTKR